MLSCGFFLKLIVGRICDARCDLLDFSKNCTKYSGHSEDKIDCSSCFFVADSCASWHCDCLGWQALLLLNSLLSLGLFVDVVLLVGGCCSDRSGGGPRLCRSHRLSSPSVLGLRSCFGPFCGLRWGPFGSGWIKVTVDFRRPWLETANCYFAFCVANYVHL